MGVTSINPLRSTTTSWRGRSATKFSRDCATAFAVPEKNYSLSALVISHLLRNESMASDLAGHRNRWSAFTRTQCFMNTRDWSARAVSQRRRAEINETQSPLKGHMRGRPSCCHEFQAAAHVRHYCTSIAETIASPLVGLNSRITMPSLALTSKSC